MNVCRVSFVGRPNAGKSTLMNCILHRKLAIVSPKANTTRSAISGSYSDSNIDIEITDTPGLEENPRNRLGRLLIASARSEFMSANVIALIIDGAGPIMEQDYALYIEAIENNKSVLIVLTKTDLVKPREKLLPKIEQIQGWGYKGVVWLISSKTEKGLEMFKNALLEYSTEGESYGVNISKEKFASECTREQAFRLLNQEIPYGLWVETKWIRETEPQTDDPSKYLCEVEQIIYILEERHKPIVLGARGQMIKMIGSRSREALSKIWKQKVRLFITVKIGEEEDLLKSCSI